MPPFADEFLHMDPKIALTVMKRPRGITHVRGRIFGLLDNN